MTQENKLDNSKSLNLFELLELLESIYDGINALEELRSNLIDNPYLQAMVCSRMKYDLSNAYKAIYQEKYNKECNLSW